MGDRWADETDPWKRADLMEAELRNLRLENAYYRQQLAANRPPKYFSSQWVRQPGDNIQPQIPRGTPGYRIRGQ